MIAKELLMRHAPGIAQLLRGVRRNRQIQRVERRLGLEELSQTFIAAHGLKVLDGPFAGMVYVPEAAGSVFVPKLLGSYESELHPALRHICEDASAPHLIVDVGCAEGYYAVGLARLIAGARVYAFDTDARARRLCARMAEANGVSKSIEVRGACDGTALQNTLASADESGSLVICDCEGFEYVLLDPCEVPALAKAHLLVELHPHEAPTPEVAQEFFGRFEATHKVQLLTSEPREPSLYAALEALPPERRAIAVDELRVAGQQWAFMIPRYD